MKVILTEESQPLEQEIVCGRHGKIMGLHVLIPEGHGYICPKCWSSWSENINKKSAEMIKKLRKNKND